VPTTEVTTVVREFEIGFDESKIAEMRRRVRDPVDIHFIHVRSEHEDALPLLVTHGWPGSIIERLKIIDPLTNPTGHGASAADAFDLVIPSLPGHG
jgi:pimeloyl-ACP methyl ester carboxylesterase